MDALNRQKSKRLSAGEVEEIFDRLIKTLRTLKADGADDSADADDDLPEHVSGDNTAIFLKKPSEDS
jgi:hypothetical protein